MTLRSLQDRRFNRLMIKLLMAVSFGFINSFSKTILNNTSLSLLEAMKYVSFPWSPVVAAHDRESFTQGLNSSGSRWLWKNYPYTQNSVMLFRSYHSPLPTKLSLAVTTRRVFPHASSMLHSPDSVHLAKSMLQLLKDIDSV